MRKMRFVAAFVLGALAISNSANAQNARIHVFESSYGLPGRAIPVTGLVAERCEGRYFCAFPVRERVFRR